MTSCQTFTRCDKCNGLYLSAYVVNDICHNCARREREDKMTRLHEELERLATLPSDDGGSDD